MGYSSRDSGPRLVEEKKEEGEEAKDGEEKKDVEAKADGEEGEDKKAEEDKKEAEEIAAKVRESLLSMLPPDQQPLPPREEVEKEIAEEILNQVVEKDGGK